MELKSYQLNVYYGALQWNGCTLIVHNWNWLHIYSNNFFFKITLQTKFEFISHFYTFDKNSRNSKAKCEWKKNIVTWLQYILLDFWV